MRITLTLTLTLTPTLTLALILTVTVTLTVTLTLAVTTLAHPRRDSPALTLVTCRKPSPNPSYLPQA